MKIETKFNIGDTVRDINTDDSGKIEEINITEFANGNRSIIYVFYLEEEGYMTRRSEDELVLVPDRYIIDLGEDEWDQVIDSIEAWAPDIPKIKELFYRAKKKES